MTNVTSEIMPLVMFPFDILELIASYLHIRTYKRLQICCKKLFQSLGSKSPLLQFHYFFTSIPSTKRIYNSAQDPSLHMRLFSANNTDFVGLCAAGCEKEAVRLLERFSLDDRKFNAYLPVCTRFSQTEAEDQDVELFDSFCSINGFNPSTLNHFYRKGLTSSLVKRMIAVAVIQNANPNHIFHSACYANDVETARLLVNVPGVDPAENECDTFGICCEEGFIEIVELFLQDPRVDPSKDDNYAIQGAAENGLLDILNILLQDPRVDPASLENYAIGAACENGHIAVVRRLLQDPRINPAADDNYAFCNTVGAQIPEETIIEVLEILVEDGRVDPLATDCEVIDRAVSHGQSLVLKYLIRLPGMVVRNAALATSAELGHVECLEFLLSLPYLNPNDPEHPAIVPACKKGQIRAVKMLLLDSRVDPSINHDYCLRIACHFKFADIVKMLLSHPSVDVTSRDNSAVKYFVRNRWEEIYQSIPKSKLKAFATSQDIFNKSLFDFTSYSDSDFSFDDLHSESSSSWESDFSSDSELDSDEDDEEDDSENEQFG